MEIDQAIKNRRTIHIFSKKSVPSEVIEKSIVAANQAPCHRRTFPWRFTSIGLKKRELLYQLQLTLKFGDKPTDESSLKSVRDMRLNPSYLLIASQICTDNQVQKLEDYAACACAIQNLSFHSWLMMLVASGQQEKLLQTLIPIKSQKLIQVKRKLLVLYGLDMELSRL